MTVLLAFATVAILAAMSVAAASRIAPGAQRLTMQWGFDGRPNWSLPRHAALACTPVLAMVVLALIVLAGKPVATVLPVCAVFIGVHALHLFLLAKRGG